jgi:hypothetical protein
MILLRLNIGADLRLCLTLLVTWAFVAGAMSQDLVRQNMTTYYVKPGGDDGADGSAEQPFASLARALAATRQLPRGTPRRIEMADGDYYDVAEVLTATDEGLTIEAAKSSTPRLLGGRPIKGWRPDGNGQWSAAIPADWDFRMLIVDDRICPRARYPREGRLQHLSEFDVRWMSTTKGGWERPPTQEELTTLRFAPGVLPATVMPANLELTIYHCWDESLVGVASIDHSVGAMRFSTPAGHPPGSFGFKEQAHQFVAWNIREGLTDPGQWYLDRVAGRVVYWPLEGQDMTRAVVLVLAPRATSVLRLNGTPQRPVRLVTLRGLTLGVTTTLLKSGGFGALEFDGALAGQYVEDSTFESLTIRHAGGQAIKLTESGRVTIRRCDVSELGAGGIIVQGGEHVQITDNHIHHVGLSYPSALALRCLGTDHLIAHNHIHHVPYSAINAGGTRIIMEHNLLHHAMQVLFDGAAIYVLGGKQCVIRGNHAHSLGPDDRFAYYLDEQCDGCLVEGNLAMEIAAPLHMHMASNGVVRDNVCISPSSMLIAFPNCHGFVLERNVLVCRDTMRILSSYTGLARLSQNIFHSAQGKVEWQLHDKLPSLERNTAPVPLLPQHEQTVLSDPLLIDIQYPERGYQPASPARALGLRPIDVSRAGIRRE